MPGAGSWGMLMAMSKAPEASCAWKLESSNPWTKKRMRDAYPEHGRGSAWIEARFADYQSQLVKHSVHRRSELSRPCGGNHFAACSHEQWVADLLSESCQCVTDGRLGQEHPLRGARHVALRHHGVEHAKKVQIEVRYIHAVHSDYDENALPLCLAQRHPARHGHCSRRSQYRKDDPETGTRTAAAVVSPVQAWPVQHEEGRD